MNLEEFNKEHLAYLNEVNQKQSKAIAKVCCEIYQNKEDK